MSAGFTRRFSSLPATDVITQIEGVVIVDNAPVGLQGQSTGVVAVVGEFADMSYASSVSADGVVSEHVQPVAILSAIEVEQKLGGLDLSLGDIGNANGNGWLAIQNKTFSGLVAVPVNLCSDKAVRIFRALPVCTSNSVPTPIGGSIPGAIVAAGTVLTNGGNSLKLAQSVTFSNAVAYKTGTDGEWGGASPAAAQSFVSDGGNFLDGSVSVGDILVSGTYAVDENAGTYRIKSITNGTTLLVEKMDKSSFDLYAVGATPWRIHAGACADSSVVAVAAGSATGCQVRVRSLGPSTISVNAVLASSGHALPTVGAWTDALAGLGGLADAGDVTYAAVQGANVANSSAMITKYESAIDALLADADPANLVNIVVSARSAAGIANKLREHVDSASSQGKGRICVVSPGVQTLSLNTVVGSSGSGTDTAFGVAAVGAAGRDDRVIYSWPAVRTKYLSAEGVSLDVASGYPTTDGILDMQADMWLASVMSNLPPENNPAQGAPPVPSVLQNALGYGRGTPSLKIADYTQMRQSGLCAIRIDSASGAVFQSGITTSLDAGEKNIARRRMADYIQDSLAAVYQNYVKLPLTTSLKSSIVNETVAFLDGLKSPNNVSAQRIVDYLVDGKSANTPALEAQGIYQVIVKVRTLASADFIVLNSSIGEAVSFTSA